MIGDCDGRQQRRSRPLGADSSTGWRSCQFAKKANLREKIVLSEALDERTDNQVPAIGQHEQNDFERE